MTSREKVLTRLDSTGIRREDEAAVPVNGLTVPLPYMVIRTIEKDTWDDLGRVCVKTIMTDLVEVVRDTSDESRAEILALFAAAEYSGRQRHSWDTYCPDKQRR